MPKRILLNPKKLNREYPDLLSKQIMEKTVAFFEGKGKRRLKLDDHERVWYSDFLEFVQNEHAPRHVKGGKGIFFIKNSPINPGLLH